MYNADYNYANKTVSLFFFTQKSQCLALKPQVTELNKD